jgi:hypothetical protein
LDWVGQRATGGFNRIEQKGRCGTAADDDGVGDRRAESAIRCDDMVWPVSVFYVVNRHVLFLVWHGLIEMDRFPHFIGFPSAWSGAGTEN